jgi:hypothetical protein
VATQSTGISLSTTARDLIRSGFFGKDFDTIVAELCSFIQLRFGPEVASNIVASEQGIMLIEAFSFAMSTGHWYGDRQADDTNLDDARLRSAAVVIARQLGYKPRAAVAPAVEITITLDTVPPARLTIEAGRKLNGPQGLIFEVVDELVFDPGEVGPKTFSARQGETREELFVSTNEPIQTFFITTVPDGQSITQDSPRAFVAGVEWDENEFLTFEQTNQFEFQYGFSPPRAVFGDGIAGNIPPEGAEIRGGSVPANTVTVFSEPLAAGDGTLIEATLVHDDPSTPGSDRETIASIKTNAPQVFQAADRAVTLADYDALINAFLDPVFGSVAIGRATTPRSVDEDAQALTILAEIETSCPSTLNHGGSSGTFVVGETITGGTSGATGVVLSVATLSLAQIGTGGTFAAGEQITGGTSGATATISSTVSSDIATDLRAYWDKVLASNCQANVVIAQILSADSVGRYVTAPVGLARSLEEFLDARAESTVKVQVVDGSVNLLSVDITASVKTTSEFSSADQQATVATNVRQTIEGILLGRNYGESLRISDLYQAIDSLEGVDYSNVAITNQTSRLNSFGDLEITEFEVITLGVQPIVGLL